MPRNWLLKICIASGMIHAWLLLPNLARAQSASLSSQAQISLITGAPGEDLHTLFGHSAIRVYDPSIRMDLMFNYGVFDFDTPHFAFRFAQGSLDYMLAVDTEGLAYLQKVYQYENRSLYEQVLDLNPEQKQVLLDLLRANAQEANRYYRYDFFYDNCATRIRDIFVKAWGEQLQFRLERSAQAETFRDFIEPYLKEPWLELGIDLLLGVPSDQIATPYESMFLPDYLMWGLEQAKIKQGDEWQDLVQEKKVLHQRIVARPNYPLLNPYSVFWTIFFVFLFFSLWENRQKAWYRGVDIFWFGLLGLVGSFLLLMWLGTDHGALKQNYNLLWALPSHMFVVWFLLGNRRSTWLPYYFGGTVLLTVLTLLFWPILPQALHPALIPLLLVSIIRASLVFFRLT